VKRPPDSCWRLAGAPGADGGGPRRVRPWPLPALSRADVAWANRLARCAEPLGLRLDGRRLRLRLRPPAASPPEGTVVALRLGEAALWLCVTRWLPAGGAGPSLPLAEAAELPAPLQGAVLESALAPFLARLEPLLGQPLQVTGLLPALPADAERRLALWLEDESGARALAEVAGEPPALADLAALLARWPQREPPHLGALRVVLRLVIGEAQLTAAELRGLAVGDAVFLPDAQDYRRGLVSLRLPSDQRLLAERRGDRIMVKGTDETPQEEAPAGAPVDVDELRFRIEFDIGAVTVHLRELKALRPGHVFELERPPGELVTLHSNGQRLGTGELVEVEGRVAVRIVELFGHKDG